MEELMLKDREPMSPVMKDIYRRICTNIEFTGVENRAICLTSCEPNDGKSTISYGLAKIFAEGDKNVLLIDADMRNSVMGQQKGFKRNLKGLSHFLSGKDSMADVIYSTNFTNFFLLPTGVFPKNPMELLKNPRFANLIAASKKAFDYVIIDTPPLGSVIDAAVIARECDGSILVIADNKVSRKLARNVKNQLKQANDNLLGVILNNAEMHSGVYGKRYGYGYGYGYGAYGYGEKNGK